MCGIYCRLGELEQIDLAKEHEWVEKYLGRRGPDAVGVEVLEWADSKSSFGFRSAVLGHSRLAVMDPSANGAQPMTSVSGNWIISFNGCVYNFKELAKRYLSDLDLRSHSDTEVLVNLVERYKHEILPKLNGMFAFVAINKSSHEYLIARDRFGVKPLCFFENPGALEISSSPRLLAHRFDRKISLPYIRTGLSTGVFDGGRGLTAFEGIYEFPAGHYLSGKLDETLDVCDAVPWFSLDSLQCSDTGLEEQELDVHDLLGEAVRARLVADVPVAVSQSGGIDSSIISAIARSEINCLQAFTFGVGKDSEVALAKKHCEEHDISLIEVAPAFDAESQFQELLCTFDAQEAPFMGLSVVAQNLIFKCAKEQGVKVLLGGQGADEIFGGYRKYLIASVFHPSSDLDVWSRAKCFVTLLSEITSSARYSIKDILSRLFGISRHRGLNVFNKLPVDIDGRKGHGVINPTRLSLKAYRSYDVAEGSLPTLLRYEDRNSMYHGIETRLPFLDWRVVALGINKTESQLFKNGYPKYILRKSFNEYLNPAIAWERKKRGFDTSKIYQTREFARLKLDYITDNYNLLEEQGVWSDEVKGFIEKSKGKILNEELPLVLVLVWIIYETKLRYEGI